MIAYFQEDIYSRLLPVADKAMIEETFYLLNKNAVWYKLEDSPCGQSFYIKILAQKCTLDEEVLTDVFYRIWQYCEFEIKYVARDSGHFYINVYPKKEDE